MRRRRGVNPKADLLGQLRLFERLSRAQRARLAKMTEELDFSAGRVLCHEGRPARELFVLVEGRAEMTRRGAHIRSLGPGDFFGGVEALEHSLRSATVTSLTSVRLFVFSSRTFWNVVGQNPAVECEILRTLVRENAAVRTIAETALEHQALHDALTGLPNRTLFHDRIKQALAATERYRGRVAVLVLDLDRFKEVNDTLGHYAGDLLLQKLGDRLSRALRESDTIARLGGDEFGVILLGESDPLEIAHVMERMRQAVERPILIHDLPLAIEASVGVAFSPEHGTDVHTLLQRADTAMYKAKAGHSFYAFYDETTDEHTLDRVTLLADLRAAIDYRELVVHFQPQIAVPDGKVTSVEALVRWQHPHRGLVRPDEFIPVVQHTGLIKPLTLYVIEEAVRACRSWEERGHELSVSVNLAARNLLDADLPEDVAEILARHDLDPARLMLEITESAVLADRVRTSPVLERFSGIGVRLSLDDFGTGYSSFSNLRRLPLDEVKIERSFVANMLTSEDDAIIVRSTIDLGRNLGLDVVAEGVESEEAWAELRRLGCDLAQGYLVSPPLPADELAAFLDSWGHARFGPELGEAELVA